MVVCLHEYESQLYRCGETGTYVEKVKVRAKKAVSVSRAMYGRTAVGMRGAKGERESCSA